MIPVVTPEEMRRLDAQSSVPFEILVERAGAAVARRAIAMLNGVYGRHIAVVAGPGTNGADGRVAARRLRARGAGVRVLDAETVRGRRLEGVDLVIDAAYGTGFRGHWESPEASGAQVLAVDLPSGVNGSTGESGAGVAPADVTVTFAALKPGLVLQPGRSLAGRVEVADIGLEVPEVATQVVEASDIARWCPPRAVDTHKWRAAVRVVAGAPTMAGAGSLCALGALRAGAGMVHLSHPARAGAVRCPTEVVEVSVSPTHWDTEVLEGLGRFGALAIGPGLGREDSLGEPACRVIAEAPVPVVVDGDAFAHLAAHRDGPEALLGTRRAPTVLTPHDGEVALLTGAVPGVDRIAASRDLARRFRAVVVLKGPTTVVADPAGSVRLVTSGDSRLATAGTGDVLTGIIAALAARGLAPLDAAAAGAFLHGLSASTGPRQGLLARDVVEGLVAAWAMIDEIRERR